MDFIGKIIAWLIAAIASELALINLAVKVYNLSTEWSMLIFFMLATLACLVPVGIGRIIYQIIKEKIDEE